MDERTDGRIEYNRKTLFCHNEFVQKLKLTYCTFFHKSCERIHAWTDGALKGRVGGWMDGWMDGWMGGWMDRWVNGWMDGWMDGWVDGWMDG